MIAKIRETACIDPKRIYAVGYSMGGGMSYKLACDAADIIAAVAPAAFELMEDNEWPCNPVATDHGDFVRTARPTSSCRTTAARRVRPTA